MGRPLALWLCALLASSLPRRLSALPVTFQPLPIGGGGFVTGLFPTPRSAAGAPTVYARTDVGGVYRLLNGTGGALAWRPLTDAFTFRQRNYYGVEALAVSALSTERLWAVLGAYLDSAPDTANAGVFGSSDGGESWALLSPPAWAVRAAGNDSPSRGLGERLAVHPATEATLLYGSHLDGLWRGAGAPLAWARVPCDQVPCASPQGALALLFDAASPGGSTVYAALPGLGVWASADAGGAWAALAGSPGDVRRLALAPAPQQQPAGPATLLAATSAGVWRLDAGAWALATPDWPGTPFTCIDVNPFNARDFLAMLDPGEPALPSGALRSVDGGATWGLVAQQWIRDYELPWWNASFHWDHQLVDFRLGGTTLKFGTGAPGQVWNGDSWDAWLSSDFENAVPGAVALPPVRWAQVARGAEEVFVLSMAAPHVGPTMLTGTADLAGFVHQGALSEYPLFSFFGFGAWGGEGTGIAYTEAVAQHPAAGPVPAAIYVTQARAFVCNNGPAVQVSSDGGRSWRLLGFNNTPGNARSEVLGVAVAAHAPGVVAVLVANATPWASADGGASWRPAAGLPPFPFPLQGYSGNRYNMSRALAADRPLAPPAAPPPHAFLYAHCPAGEVYASRDALAWARAPGTFPGGSQRCALEAHPTPAGGAFWAAADAQGLHFTSTGGAAFARVAGVARAHTVAVGAPLQPGGAALVAVFGLPAGSASGEDLRLLVSADLGSSWVSLVDARRGLGNWPEVLVASRQLPGVIAVGSFGRGAMWVNASAALQARQ